MKNLFHFLVLSFFVVTVLSCQKECECAGKGKFEYMVFGHFYGKCAGEGCVEIFKIDEESLYEDSTDVYPNGLAPYIGQYTLLPDAKFQLVKDLIQAFPEALYAEPNNVIGMPDAGDWGGVYVEIKYENEEAFSGFWLLDQHEGNMPQIYNDFVDKINEKIALINQ